MRKICMLELLNGKRVESFGGVREEEALALVRSIWEKSEHGRVGVDLSESVACHISVLLWRILTGRTNADRLYCGTEFEGLIWEGNKLMGAVNVGDFIPWLEWLDLQGLRRRMKNVFHRLDAVFDKIIDEHVERKERKGRPSAEEEEERQKDLIDVLVDRDNITDDERKGIIMDMFLAAIESSASPLDCALSELVRNPDVTKKLQAEIDSIVKKDDKLTASHIVSMEYLHCVLKETMRLYPLGPLLIPYESREDCVMGGPHQDYFILTKTRVIVNAWAIGRDPKIWEDPLEFKLERFLGKIFDIIRDPKLSMIPFGLGRRSCPGASMAIANMEMALGYLVHYFNWKSKGEVDTRESFGITIPRKVHLFVTPTLRVRMNEHFYLKV